MRVLAGLLPNRTMALELTRSVTSLLDQASPLNSGSSQVDLAGRVVAVVAQITAEAVEQAGKGRVVGCPGLGHRAAELTGAVLDVEGVVTVLLLDGGHGVGDVRDGLVPGDSLVLAFTALGAGNTAQRSLDTRVVVEALTVRAAAHAGAHLVDLVGTEVVAAVVVVAHADHGAVLDVHLERAAAAAVHMAASPDHLVVRELLLVGNLRGVLVGFGIVGEHIARDARPRQRAPGAQHGAHSNKGPTTYIVLRVSHTAPIPSPLLDHGGKGPARACVRISPPPARPSPRAAMAILRTGRPRVGDTPAHPEINGYHEGVCIERPKHARKGPHARVSL